MSLTQLPMTDVSSGSLLLRAASTTPEPVHFEIGLGLSDEYLGLLSEDTEIPLPVFYRDIASLYPPTQVATRTFFSSPVDTDRYYAAVAAFRGRMESEHISAKRFVLHESVTSFRDAIKGGKLLTRSYDSSKHDDLEFVIDDHPERISPGIFGPEMLKDPRPEVLEVATKLIKGYSKGADPQRQGCETVTESTIRHVARIIDFLSKNLSKKQTQELVAARERDRQAGTGNAYSEASLLRAQWLNEKWRQLMADKGENRAPLAIRVYADPQVIDDHERVETLMLEDPHEVLTAAGTDPEPNQSGVTAVEGNA